MRFDYVEHLYDGAPVIFAIPAHRHDRYSEQLRREPIKLDAVALIHEKAKLLERPLRIVDVGANLGTVCLPLAAAGHKVLAIEPEVVNFGALLAGVAKNGFRNITAVHAAASSQWGTVGIEGDSAWATVNQSGANALCCPLNDLLKAYGFQDADIIKIDIEGHELDALTGIEETVQINSGLEFIYESNTVAASSFGHTAQELVARFEQLGYRNYVWRSGKLMATDSANPQAHWVEDLFATRNKDVYLPDVPFNFKEVELEVRKSANRPLAHQIKHALLQEEYFPKDWRNAGPWSDAKSSGIQWLKKNTARALQLEK